jgi:hypothetical protein
LNGLAIRRDKCVISVTKVLPDGTTTMNLTSAKLAAAALLLAFSATVSHAEGSTPDASKAAPKPPIADPFVQRVFAAPIGLDKTTYACFTRAYDPAHLAEHPQQKVSAMKLLLTAQKYPEDNEMNYTFRLGVKYRSKSGNYDSSGDCGHGQFTDEKTNEATLGCGVDCDGGGIGVTLANGDKAVIVKLDRVRMWKDKNYDEDAAQDLVAGADDKAFRLDRTSVSDCEALVTDRKELAAMRHK